MGVFFDADLAEIAQGAHDCRHCGLWVLLLEEGEPGEERIGQSNNNGEVDRGESELKEANATSVFPV